MSSMNIKMLQKEMDDMLSNKVKTRLDKINDYLFYLRYDIWSWFNDHNPMHVVNRMIRYGVLLRCHRLNIETLPASWRDSDFVMLHANFQILTNFVEEECSHMATTCDIEGILLPAKKYKKENGVLYLKEYINNPEIDDKKSDLWADACKQVLDLYTWWTVDRLARIEPTDVIVDTLEHDLLMDYWSTNTAERKQFLKDNPGFKKAYTKWSKQCDKSNAIEAEYDLEDTEMLVNLIKIRHYMWT